MKKSLRNIVLILSVIYLLICAAMFFFQEALLFHPTKLSKDHVFRFAVPFNEKFIRTDAGLDLHCLLFNAYSSKGVILYLHGNGGTLDTWGNVASTYTDLRYDVFMLDYPGYGKSNGTIDSEAQLFSAVQTAYDTLKTLYGETRIVVLGYSIGTGLASKVASTNHPRMLILQAPYYSMKDLAHRQFPWVPSFVLRYPLRTDVYIRSCTMPIVSFHGDHDQVIPYASSIELAKAWKAGDTLITLHDWGHNGFTENSEYLEAITKVLK